MHSPAASSQPTTVVPSASPASAIQPVSTNLPLPYVLPSSHLPTNVTTQPSATPATFTALFTPSFLYEIKTQSNNSRTAFAMNLVRHLFDEETQASSNMSGKCGKRQLN